MPEVTRARDPVIVIPAYDEARAIDGVLKRCRATGFPVIVVDDGSRDATAAIAAAHAVTLIRHGANRGKGAALVTGMRRALVDRASAVVTLDGDGQHRPEDVTRLIEAARDDPDGIVIGSRRAERDKAPRARATANRVADFWISWAGGRLLEDTQSGFRLYPAPVLRALLARCAPRHGFAFESALLIEAARRGVPIRSVAIPALYDPTVLRASHFRPVHDIAAITAMVAGKLLARGLDPLALARVLAARRRLRAPLGHAAVYRDDLP